MTPKAFARSPSVPMLLADWTAAIRGRDFLGLFVCLDNCSAFAVDITRARWVGGLAQCRLQRVSFVSTCAARVTLVVVGCIARVAFG